MVALTNVEFLTDTKGKKKSVVLPVAKFNKLQEDIEDLEDALALERSRKTATGFKLWADFVREAHAAKK